MATSVLYLPRKISAEDKQDNFLETSNGRKVIYSRGRLRFRRFLDRSNCKKQSHYQKKRENIEQLRELVEKLSWFSGSDEKQNRNGQIIQNELQVNDRYNGVPTANVGNIIS